MRKKSLQPFLMPEADPLTGEALLSAASMSVAFQSPGDRGFNVFLKAFSERDVV